MSLGHNQILQCISLEYCTTEALLLEMHGRLHWLPAHSMVLHFSFLSLD